MKTYTHDALHKILSTHGKWLESCRAAGARADLSGANLIDADLRGADLRGADLSGANDCIEVPVGDPRGYRCIAIRFGDEWRIFAGFRGPLALAEAEKHWGTKYKGNREIGDRYLHGLRWLRERVGVAS